MSLCSHPAKYLFIDGAHVQDMTNLNLVLHQPDKMGIVLVPDKPWEGQDLNSILGGPMWCEERNCWRMWYLGGEREGRPLYAESVDGKSWRKPDLGLVSWNGSTQNNIIDLGFAIAHPKEVRMYIIRKDDDPNPGSRFRGLTRIGKKMRTMVSADGLSWQVVKDDVFRSDDQYHWHYDISRQLFIATVKQSTDNRDNPSLPGDWDRRVTLSTSSDGAQWSTPEEIFRSDEEDKALGAERIDAALADPLRQSPSFVNEAEYGSDVYNMQVFRYHDLYLALPTMFNKSGLLPDRNQDGIAYPSLVASRDLLQWDRLSREPFIPLSRMDDSSVVDYGSIFSISEPVQRGDELWFYYWGRRHTHVSVEQAIAGGQLEDDQQLRSAIHLARLRLDGFASMSARGASGSLVTVPVEVNEEYLHVNANAAGGELRVELRDAQTGDVIPGFSVEDNLPTTSDGVATPIRWRGSASLEALRGQMVQICFHLNEADLYAFWFQRDSASPTSDKSQGKFGCGPNSGILSSMLLLVAALFRVSEKWTYLW